MSKIEKNFFNFVKGLNTEAGELTFPDDTALDIENFELRISGKLERRKGLRIEKDSTVTGLVAAVAPTHAFSKFTWHGPGGDPLRTFVVVQHGAYLYFYNDGVNLTNNVQTFTGPYIAVNLAAYQTSTLLADTPCTFSEGRTKLFVANRYMESIYITYDPVTNLLSQTVVNPRIRNFEDTPDNVAIDHQPSAAEMATISPAYFFNLKVRGWKTADITQYFTDKAAWPAKNQIWYRGYQQKAPAGLTLSTSDLNPTAWLKEWNSDLLEQELFGNNSAARGSLIYSPYDSSSMEGSSGTSATFAITSWTVANAAASIWYLTLNTAAPHGRTTGDKIDITGNAFKFKRVADGNTYDGTLDSSSISCLAGTGGTVIYVQIPTPASNWLSFPNQYRALGYINTLSLVNPTFYTTTERPSAVGYWAGRLWLSGISHPKLSDLVLFSQIAVEDSRYDKMYQEQDPTSPNLSALLADDGGVIQIPGMIDCRRIIPVGNSLVLIASNGVWEIVGGRGGFAADSYGVRKLSDVEALNSLGVDRTEYGILFTSLRGVYVVTGDEQTQNLVATSISEDVIQTYWNAIPDDSLAYAQLVYDSAMKRVRILYSSVFNGSNPYSYDKELIYDMRLKSWYPLRYPLNLTTGYISGILCVDAADNSNENRKTKYFVVTPNSTTLRICDQYHTVQVPNRFRDFDDTQLLPYVVTGYDNIGDFATKRQAPFITVFTKRVEDVSTGEYFGSGGTIVDTPINYGSLTIQSRWDWADNNTSGKWGTTQQVYRPKHFTLFPTPDNSEPVLVAKVKIRGYGRSLHLKFIGATDKDCILVGWSVMYRTTRSNTNDGGTRDR